MTEDYTIEQLEKTFKEHAEKNIRNHEKDEESFKTKYPGEKLPDHYVNYFNISEALHVICREINQLKYKISLFEEVTETSISVEEMNKMINNISGVTEDLLGQLPID